nr:MAG TPA_asm: hypothetical protein [Caudoviricetes sp.]
MKYTYEDIIIDPRDERLKGAIGKEVFYDDIPILAVQYANQNVKTGTLIRLKKKGEPFPFWVQRKEVENKFDYVCIIIKKEPKVKYVPFDLSKVEDRDFLRGKWIRHKMTGDEYQITSLSKNLAIGTTGKELLKYYTFIDCSPVGKKVEE